MTDSATQPPGAASLPNWQALRREFPATEHFVYLDIARKAILPQLVEDAMREWFADINERVGEAAFSMSVVEQTRDVVAEVFGARRDEIAFIKNTSEGLNIVARGFPWKAGDNVVISTLEHENNTFPWRHAAAPHGIEVRIATPDAQGRVTPDCYREVVDDRTRVLAATWVTYACGCRADLRELAAFCKERGIKLVIDGIQAVGTLADRLDGLGADVIVAGGHKSQFSLAGAGFMYAAPEMIDMLRPPYAAKFSFTSNDRTQPELTLAVDAHRFEYGNPNFLGRWVQRRSAEFIRAIGLANIEARVRDLTTRLIDDAERRGLTIRTPRPWTKRASIVSFDVGSEVAQVVARLKEQGIIVSARDGLLRASVHFYNSEDDLDRFLDALQALQASGAVQRHPRR